MSTGCGVRIHGGKSPLNQAILDTDIFSEMTKGVDRKVAANATAYRRVFGRVRISTVTLMKVVRGYQQKQAFRQMQSFLTAIAAQEVIAFDQTAAKLSGRIGGELERIG